MKLQKVKARKYKGKTIYKYMIVIPPKDIKELDWKEGMELQGSTIQNKIYLIFPKEKI